MADENLTKMEALVDPEVLAPMVETNFGDALAFLDVMDVDRTLVGQPGTTVTIPQYGYIGKATVVAEGDAYPIKKLSTSTVNYTIHKYGMGVTLSDEALLSAYGNPMPETVKQLGQAIAESYNDEMSTALSKIEANMTHKYGKLGYDSVAQALTLFGERENKQGVKFLYVNSKQLSELRLNANFLPYTSEGVNVQRTGALGNIWGCEVVLSDRVPEGESYIVCRGYATLLLKREIQVESKRVQENGTYLVTANKHGMVSIRDKRKAIKLKFDASLVPAPETPEGK